MNVTDKDLEIVKSLIYGPHDHEFAVVGNGASFKLNLNSLLHRLEAAEECVRFIDCSEVMPECVKRWRKASGK
jgi:hypothetical protein